MHGVKDWVGVFLSSLLGDLGSVVSGLISITVVLDKFRAFLGSQNTSGQVQMER